MKEIVYMNSDFTLDLKGLKCPQPILHTKKKLATMPSGSTLTVWATDKGAVDDFAAFCRHTGHILLQSEVVDDVFTFLIQRK